MNTNTGCISYAVIDVGGWLGMGARHHIIPWSGLSWSPDGTQLLVGMDRQQFANAPLFDRDHPPNWNDQGWMQSVYSFYGMNMQGSTMGGQQQQSYQQGFQQGVEEGKRQAMQMQQGMGAGMHR